MNLLTSTDRYQLWLFFLLLPHLVVNHEFITSFLPMGSHLSLQTTVLSTWALFCSGRDSTLPPKRVVSFLMIYMNFQMFITLNEHLFINLVAFSICWTYECNQGVSIAWVCHKSNNPGSITLLYFMPTFITVCENNDFSDLTLSRSCVHRESHNCCQQ